MINTYEAYLKHPAKNVITIEECQRIYKAMADDVDKCVADDKMEFWNEVIISAARYCKIRNDWETMTRDEKVEADGGRTSAHDAVITNLNVLTRVLENEGIDTSWRSELGDQRKRIGDFACFISFITGISNR